MFITAKKLKKLISEAINGSEDSYKQNQNLHNEKASLEHRIRELEHKKELEEKELAHLVKMKEEKQAVELAKREVELEKKFNTKEMELQRTYHDKVMGVVNKEHQDIKEIYKQIMERLPNVNVEVKRKS